MRRVILLLALVAIFGLAIGDAKRAKRSSSESGGSSSNSCDCSVTLCDDPGEPTNGMRVGDLFTVGNQVSFSCEEGYVLEGHQSLACLANSQWSSSVPVCARNVRLVGGSSPSEGRLEVYHAGQWGTVCDDGFTTSAAHVACRSLGYTGTSTFVDEAELGEGSGFIGLDNVNCTGQETHILDCLHDGWGVQNCRHREDVGVRCSN